MRHDDWKQFLEELRLTPEHKASLVSRGFTQEDIAQYEFKSMPQSRMELCKKLAKKMPLRGIPGFYEDGDRWTFVGGNGIVIPIRTKLGEIDGLKIRLDQPIDGRKFQLFSSNPDLKIGREYRYKNGTAEKLKMFYPFLMHKPNQVIRITEGEMKSIIATNNTGIYTVSIPGVKNIQLAMEAIDHFKPKKILICFDSDKDQEFTQYAEEVAGADRFPIKQAMYKLYVALIRLGYEVEIETWPARCGKGIDDVILNGKEDEITYFTKETILAELKLIFGELFGQDWCYILKTKCFFNVFTGLELDKEQFNDKYPNAIPGRGKTADKCIANPLFPKVDYPIYEPMQSMFFQNAAGNLFINTWKKCDIVAKKPSEKIKYFTDHIKLLTNHQESEFNIVVNFLAFICQHPGEKVLWSLLLQGGQGVGKSYVAYVLRQCVGDANVVMPSNEVLHENFTGWAKSTQLIVVEEAMARGRLDLMNKLKPMITQPTITIREMYKPPYEQPNRFNLLLLTNYEDSIIIDQDDRRYAVIFCKSQQQDKRYYTELWNWTKHNMEEIYGYLMGWDLSNFNPQENAPQTSAKQILIGNSTTPVEQFIMAKYHANEWPMNCDFVVPLHLSPHIPSYCGYRSINILESILKKLGGVRFDGIKFPNGTTHNLWCIRNRSVYLGSKSKQRLVSDRDIAELYNNWKQSVQNEQDPTTNNMPL